MKRIFDNIQDKLTKSYYGYKIMAAYIAYGSTYDFCKFYSCGDGVVHIYNSSMVIDGNVDTDELEILIKMTKPANIEVSSCTTLHNNDEYKKNNRTLFRATSAFAAPICIDVKINTFTHGCYDILSESFENMGDFDSWYVDISHRIRHKVSDLYLFDNTTITKQFNINGFVFLSHVATAKESRGRGSARKLLHYLTDKYHSEGCKTYLFALDHRKSFYESIGFEAVDEDILYEMEG